MLLGVELRGRDLRLEPDAKILLSYIAIDAEGKMSGGNTDALTLTNLKPETKARIERSGLRMLNRLDLPPGRISCASPRTTRPAATSARCMYDLDVPDFAKAPFTMSGLVLTSRRRFGAADRACRRAAPTVLPGPPVALRTFPQNDEIALFAEVYDNAGPRRTRSTSSPPSPPTRAR